MTRWNTAAFPVPKRLKAIPPAALFIIVLLIIVNCLIWAACGIVLHFHPRLISSAVLSYTFGLRHALDADHISAIDLMTRRLIAAGQRPATVGTFFSLGHSTVVVITCIVVAATSGALRDRFDKYEYYGGIIGTSVSATFLVVLCAANAWILCKLIQRLRDRLRHQNVRHAAGEIEGEGEGGEEDTTLEQQQQQQQHIESFGLISKMLRAWFRIIDRPWKMYFIGFVFGLGFDTSSEIAILGIASLQGAQGTSMWLILIFPILFTGGMCLVDTLDGAMMLTLYTSKAFSRDLVAILYYSIMLTGVTIVVSAFISVIQFLNLAEAIAEPKGAFWDGLDTLGDHWDIIGGCICGVFLVAGVGSILFYGPWKRRMERGQRRRSVVGTHEEDSGSQHIAPHIEV